MDEKQYFPTTVDYVWIREAVELYALFYAISYKGLEHPWILISMEGGGSWNQSLHFRYQGMTNALGLVKSSMWIF